MAIAAAAEALIDRVDPNCAIENVPSQCDLASSDSPGPSWPKRRHTRRGSANVYSGRDPGRLSIPYSATPFEPRSAASSATVWWWRMCW